MTSLWTPNVTYIEITEEGMRSEDMIGENVTVENIDQDDVDRIRTAGTSRPQAPATRPQKPARDDAAPEATHDDGLVRLSKRMSELGLCSRREADEWIPRGASQGRSEAHEGDGGVADIVGRSHPGDRGKKGDGHGRRWGGGGVHLPALFGLRPAPKEQERAA